MKEIVCERAKNVMRSTNALGESQPGTYQPNLGSGPQRAAANASGNMTDLVLAKIETTISSKRGLVTIL